MTRFAASGPVTLKTNLADAANVAALKEGRVASPLVDFDFCGPKVANQGFKPMVRERKFDAGELAIVTYLQARLYGKPVVLLPATILGRFQHHCAWINPARGTLAAGDLAGRTVGVRAYAQTTALWVRAIIQHDHGVPPEAIRWAVFEDAHLAEYVEPDFCHRLPPGRTDLEAMLIDGEIDVAILSGAARDERLRTLIPDPKAAAAAWHERHRTVPVNHLFAIDADLSRERPDVVREIYRLLKEARAAMGPVEGPDIFPFGFDAVRPAIALAVEYALEQRIIDRRFSVEELFDDVTGSLD